MHYLFENGRAQDEALIKQGVSEVYLPLREMDIQEGINLLETKTAPTTGVAEQFGVNPETLKVSLLLAQSSVLIEVPHVTEFKQFRDRPLIT